MTGIVIGLAALHRALDDLRKLGAERENDADAAAFFIDGLNVLAALFDPKHAPAQPQGLARKLRSDDDVASLKFDIDLLYGCLNAEVQGHQETRTELARRQEKNETAGAAAVQESATSPSATARAANLPDPANAATAAPPTIDLPAGLEDAADTARHTSAPDGPPAPEAPPPARAAERHPTFTITRRATQDARKPPAARHAPPR